MEKTEYVRSKPVKSMRMSYSRQKEVLKCQIL